MNVPEQFDTERLVIRRALPLDAAQVFERWAQDSEVTRYLSWVPHRRPEDTATFLGYCWEQWERGLEFVWLLLEPHSGEFVGSLAARAGDHGINIGYLLARDAWGRGLMTGALREVSEWWLAQESVFRVWATCHPDNRASARVLEKAGFEYEGRLRSWEEYPNLGNGPRDSLCFSRVG